MIAYARPEYKCCQITFPFSSAHRVVIVCSVLRERIPIGEELQIERKKFKNRTFQELNRRTAPRMLLNWI